MPKQIIGTIKSRLITAMIIEERYSSDNPEILLATIATWGNPIAL